MSDLVVLLFKDQSTEFEMRAALAKMQKQYIIAMEDAVVLPRLSYDGPLGRLGIEGCVQRHYKNVLTS